MRTLRKYFNYNLCSNCYLPTNIFIEIDDFSAANGGNLIKLYKRKPKNPPPNPLIKKSCTESEPTYSIYKHKLVNEIVREEYKVLQPINEYLLPGNNSQERKDTTPTRFKGKIFEFFYELLTE